MIGNPEFLRPCVTDLLRNTDQGFLGTCCLGFWEELVWFVLHAGEHLDIWVISDCGYVGLDTADVWSSRRIHTRLYAIFCQKLRVQTCRHLVNVYHISWRFLQDSVRVLTRCFRGLLGTLHRKGRSRVKLIWAEIVLRAERITKRSMVAAAKIRAAWCLSSRRIR